MLKRLTLRLLASFQMAYTNLPKPHAVYFCVCVRFEASSEEATKVLGRIIVIE